MKIKENKQKNPNGLLRAQCPRGKKEKSIAAIHWTVRTWPPHHTHIHTKVNKDPKILENGANVEETPLPGMVWEGTSFHTEESGNSLPAAAAVVLQTLNVFDL